MNIIDAHLHTWLRDDPGYDWIDDPAYERTFTHRDAGEQLRENRVGRALLVQAADTRLDTDRMLACGEPWLAGVVGWIDLRDPDWGQVRAIAGRDAVVGIRHDLGPELLEEPARSHLRLCADHGLVVELTSMAQVAAVAERHPRLSLVVDHLGIAGLSSGDLPGWRASAAAAAAQPNVAVKLSGFEMWRLDARTGDPRRVFEEALSLFGPERMMYGSNWPVCRAAGGSMAATMSAARSLTADLPERDRDAIMSGNVMRIYGVGM